MKFSKDVALVVSATAGLSLKGIWARLAYAEGLDVSGVLFYRSALATPLFLLVGILLWKRGRFAQANPRSSHRVWGIAALLGAIFSVGMYSDFQAIAFLGAGVSRVILFGFPLVVMGVEGIVQRSPPPRSRVLGYAVAWVGLLCVAGGAPDLATHDWQSGLLWALASLVLYGLYVASSAPLSRRIGSVPLTIVSSTSTGVVVVSTLLLQNSGLPPSISGAAFGWVSVMVIVSTVVPYFLLTEGIRRLGGSRAGLISMLGPPLTVSVGWLLLDETLSGIQILGTMAVLLGVLLSQRARPAAEATGTAETSPTEEKQATTQNTQS